jgi:hypothetical protein
VPSRLARFVRLTEFSDPKKKIAGLWPGKAADSMLFPAGGKADTPAGRSKESAADRRRLSFVFVAEDYARRNERQRTRRSAQSFAAILSMRG